MKINFITSLLFFLPFLSTAHGYWLELDGTGKLGTEVKVKIFFGEYENNLREQGPRLAGMKEFRSYLIDPDGQQLTIELVQTQTCWEGRFKPTKAGNYQVFGVNDTREVQDLTSHGLGIIRPIVYLRANYWVGEKSNVSTAKPQTDIDILDRNEGGQLILNTFLRQKPFAKAKLTVLNPQGWEKNLVTNEVGTAHFIPSGPGLYIIESEQIDKIPGQYRGKDYPVVRIAYSLSIQVD
ncbi:nickel transport complex, NikM subunit,transmembrane [Larkinella punicea]|uniref:nickel transport complex, NikM subunit,transmembrane n=1 Tax=Larkinella punicea TaxID=2315727 RepID=UPI001E46B1A6|nr:nickel transport complex, NikM subunit,transmembrane [Larkinella punicea]